MAETTLNSAHYVQKWSAETFMEFQRESGFLPYTGEGANNVIVSRKELVSGGQTINIPFFPDLTGDGTAYRDGMIALMAMRHSRLAEM